MSHCIRRLKASAECVIIIPGFSSIFPETWNNSAKTVCVCLLWNRYDKRIWKLQSAIGNTSQIKATRLANLPEKSNAVVGFNPSHIFVAHIPISICEATRNMSYHLHVASVPMNWQTSQAITTYNSPTPNENPPLRSIFQCVTVLSTPETYVHPQFSLSIQIRTKQWAVLYNIVKNNTSSPCLL